LAIVLIFRVQSYESLSKQRRKPPHDLPFPDRRLKQTMRFRSRLPNGGDGRTFIIENYNCSTFDN
jgi:hypothetical protein